MRALMKPQALLYSVLAILYIMLLRPLEPQVPAVFFLWLIAVTVMIIRLRFQTYRFVWLDVIAMVFLSFWDPKLALLSAPSILLMMASGMFIALPFALLLWGLHGGAIAMLWPWLFALTSGILLYVYKQSTSTSLKHIDTLREKIYTLERTQNHLLEAHHHIERTSALSERDRIANVLHDNLGHDLTGALVALRAYESTQEPTKDNPLFTQIKTRIERAVEQLKATVHQSKVEEPIGLETFESLIEEFSLVSIDFTLEGSTNELTMTHWQALVSVLKESLTNIQKHAEPTRVQVSLHVDKKIVRLKVDNDGLGEVKDTRGVGLHYMRKHIASLGGSLSIQRGFLFTLICVIPKTIKKDGAYEHLNL